ncbi:hypothetical protein GE21DRAFT_1014639 [Neurospora crassa]|nr:hypothetical protein GE21DRAFT_1014639 [Neurospora crassa]
MNEMSHDQADNLFLLRNNSLTDAGHQCCYCNSVLDHGCRVSGHVYEQHLIQPLRRHTCIRIVAILGDTVTLLATWELMRTISPVRAMCGSRDRLKPPGTVNQDPTAQTTLHSI